MATVVLGVIGNVIAPGIGGAIGAGVGATIDAAVGSAIARRLLQQEAQPVDIRKTPGVDEGVPAPWVHGSAVRVAGTTIYMSEVRSGSVPGDNKGKSPGSEIPKYFVDVAIAWCRNYCAVDPVRKIWASGEVIYELQVSGSFQSDDYDVIPVDETEELPEGTRVEDGLPWCDRELRPRKRIRQRLGSYNLYIQEGSPEEETLDLIIQALAYTQVTISGAVNGDNDGTYFVKLAQKLAGGPVVGANTYRLVLHRCFVTYPVDDPCEPDPTPCDPAIFEVVRMTNTITINYSVPNFSRYFNVIRNYTGDPDTTPSTHSLPNASPDPLIVADPEIDGLNVPAYRGTCYTVIENLDITKWAGTLPQFEAQLRERNTATPETAIDALLARSEAEETIRIDATPLFDGQTIVLGFQSAGPVPPINQIRELMMLYDFEAQELQDIDKGALLPVPVMRFTYHNDLPIVTIPYENTSAREEGSAGRVHARIRRGSKDSLPQEFTFDFSDIDREFQPSTTTYTVQTAPVQNRQKMGTTVVFNKAAADLTSRRLLWKAISFNDSMEFELPAAQLPVVEGDRIDLTPLADGTSLRGRIVSRTRGENGLFEIKAEIDDQLAYDQNEGGGYAGPQPEVIQFAPPAETRIMDIGPLTANESQTFGVYVAIQTGRNDLITTYVLYVSLDQVNWTQAATFTNPAIAGISTSVLAPPTDDSNWDAVNTVTVQLANPDHTLESLTREEVANGLNWAYLGGEVIGFTTVTVVLNPTTNLAEYELSDLLRARRDSGYYIDSHAIDETFVLLPPSGPGVSFAPLDPANYKRPVYARAVPDGFSVTDPDSAFVETLFFPNAETIRPFTVHGVWAIRRPDYSTCVFATPRTRIPFRLWSGVIVPEAETGPACEYKANVFTLNDAQDEWVFRRQVEGCAVESRFDQVSFYYSRQMVIDDLVNTGIILTPDAVGQTLFEIFRESDTIGPGRQVEFCVLGIGPEFVGDCTITPP